MPHAAVITRWQAERALPTHHPLAKTAGTQRCRAEGQPLACLQVPPPMWQTDQCARAMHTRQVRAQDPQCKAARRMNAIGRMLQTAANAGMYFTALQPAPHLCLVRAPQCAAAAGSPAAARRPRTRCPPSAWERCRCGTPKDQQGGRGHWRAEVMVPAHEHGHSKACNGSTLRPGPSLPVSQQPWRASALPGARKGGTHLAKHLRDLGGGHKIAGHAKHIALRMGEGGCSVGWLRWLLGCLHRCKLMHR